VSCGLEFKEGGGEMGYLVTLVLVIGFGLSFAAIAGVIGQARVAKSALESIARQPESATSLQLVLLIGLAFIESLVIYTLVISFILLGKLPATDKILAIIQQVTTK